VVVQHRISPTLFPAFRSFNSKNRHNLTRPLRAKNEIVFIELFFLSIDINMLQTLLPIY